ncbi:hypothetical protein N9Y42_05790 [Mariniblastus sp.]|nr:hypothetical protein [Mariniblastus sp.]
MTYTKLFLAPALLAATCFFSPSQATAQTNVIAFWDFATRFDFDDGADGPNKQDLPAAEFGVDLTINGNTNLQIFLGDASELDENGGGGFLSYTSPVSGITYGPSRTIKWDDLAGGGDPFDIGGVTIFDVSSDGAPAEPDDFGNDALIYITLDATGFQDLQLRFDLEGTPGEPDPLDPDAEFSTLPDSFDIFYRTTGPGGTWFRDINNFEVTFFDQDPANPDPENQVARTSFISLSSALNNASQLEIIINDFDRNGNDELEIDNVEIVGNTLSDPDVLLGDVNRDGTVDFSDISSFINVLSGDGFQAEADTNEDEIVDFSDIAPFIVILAS